MCWGGGNSASAKRDVDFCTRALYNAGVYPSSTTTLQSVWRAVIAHPPKENQIPDKSPIQYWCLPDLARARRGSWWRGDSKSAKRALYFCKVYNRCTIQVFTRAPQAYDVENCAEVSPYPLCTRLGVSAPPPHIHLQPPPSLRCSACLFCYQVGWCGCGVWGQRVMVEGGNEERDLDGFAIPLLMILPLPTCVCVCVCVCARVRARARAHIHTSYW